MTQSGIIDFLSFTLTMTYERNTSLFRAHRRLHLDLFLHHNATLEVKFAFMPVSTVRQVMLSCNSVNHELLGSCLVMCPSFVPAGLRGFSFRIWHINSVFKL